MSGVLEPLLHFSEFRGLMSSSYPFMVESLYLLVLGDTWTEAQVEPVQLGGTLAVINYQEEENFIWNIFSNIPPINSDSTNWGYWIGLNRNPYQSNDIWEDWGWINEDEKSYRNIAYNPGNPSSVPDGRDSPYVHVWGSIEGSHE